MYDNCEYSKAVHKNGIIKYVKNCSKQDIHIITECLAVWFNEF